MGSDGVSMLSGVDKVVRSIGSVGHATYGHTAIARWFDPRRHRRAVIFTDDQQHDAGHVRLDHVPVMYTFNLAGYRPSALPAGERGRYTLGGFTDATFTAMDVLERGRNAGWPFWQRRHGGRVAASLLVGEDHPVAVVPSEVVPGPVHEHHDPVAEPDEEHEVEPEPAQPAERPPNRMPNGSSATAERRPIVAIVPLST